LSIYPKKPMLRMVHAEAGCISTAYEKKKIVIKMSLSSYFREFFLLMF
jgi:hypothetical protein